MQPKPTVTALTVTRREAQRHRGAMEVTQADGDHSLRERSPSVSGCNCSPSCAAHGQRGSSPSERVLNDVAVVVPGVVPVVAPVVVPVEAEPLPTWSSARARPCSRS
jgi:hypothetical protein